MSSPWRPGRVVAPRKRHTTRPPPASPPTSQLAAHFRTVIHLSGRSAALSRARALACAILAGRVAWRRTYGIFLCYQVPPQPSRWCAREAKKKPAVAVCAS